MRTKAFLTIFLIILFMLAGKVVLAVSCCTGADCAGGDPGAGNVWDCQGAGEPCSLNDFINNGQCVAVAVNPPAGDGSSAGAEEISECVKLPAQVKVTLPGDSSETTFGKDVVIAPRKLTGAECRYRPTQGIQNKCTGGTSIGFDRPCYTSEFAIVVTLSYLNNVINWMFIILMMLVSLMVIYGGFLFATAAGSPDRAGRGKKVLLFAIIGFAVALLAKVIPALVKFIIGV